MYMNILVNHSFSNLDALVLLNSIQRIFQSEIIKQISVIWNTAMGTNPVSNFSESSDTSRSRRKKKNIPPRHYVACMSLRRASNLLHRSEEWEAFPRKPTIQFQSGTLYFESFRRLSLVLRAQLNNIISGAAEWKDARRRLPFSSEAPSWSQ